MGRPVPLAQGLTIAGALCAKVDLEAAFSAFIGFWFGGLLAFAAVGGRAKQDHQPRCPAGGADSILTTLTGVGRWRKGLARWPTLACESKHACGS